VLHDKLWIKLDDLDFQVPDGIDVTKMIKEELKCKAYVFAFVYEEDTLGATSPLNLLASVSATSLASDAYNLRGEVAPEVSSSSSSFTHSLASTHALASDGLDAPSPLLDSAPASVDDSEVEVVQLDKDYFILELGDFFNERSLTTEETNEWKKIFSGGKREIVATKRGIQLEKSDLRRFKHRTWLNDACIDFFLAMINELGIPGLFFFSSGFFNRY
jgi:hypothetical protein